MNIVFLDFDGVVNTCLRNDTGSCGYNYPSDNAVNNFQSVQWVSAFCEELGYDIVVTSSWRIYDNYIDCLRNGGLRSSVKVIGKTPVLENAGRGDEIRTYMSTAPGIEKYLIFDDEEDGLQDMKAHLVKCDPDTGFGISEYRKAKEADRALYGGDGTPSGTAQNPSADKEDKLL